MKPIQFVVPRLQSAPQRQGAAPGAAETDLTDRATVSSPPPTIQSQSGYYDEVADVAHRNAYYASVLRKFEGLAPAALFSKLHDILKSTHRTELGYEPSKYLFRNVDLRPDGCLHSIYTSQTVTTIDGHPSLPVVCGTDAAAVGARIALQPPDRGYNCEHAVCRKWFGDHQPMRGDLHILFTCGSEDNLERGSTPLGEGEGRFAPAAGKGAMARATLYFLLRYPCEIGVYSQEDLQTLLRWHRDDPPSLYERHRNSCIATLQGNRNPLVDFPEWADKIDFTQGL